MSFGRGFREDFVSKGLQDASETLQDGSKAAPSASKTPPGRPEMPSGGFQTLLKRFKDTVWSYYRRVYLENLIFNTCMLRNQCFYWSQVASDLFGNVLAVAYTTLRDALRRFEMLSFFQKDFQKLMRSSKTGPTRSQDPPMPLVWRLQDD